MAKIQVQATVMRHIPGKGFAAVEKIQTRAGDTIDQWITVWSPTDAAIGEAVKITGDLSVRMEEYPAGTQRATIHINGAKIERDTPF